MKQWEIAALTIRCIAAFEDAGGHPLVDEITVYTGFDAEVVEATLNVLEEEGLIHSAWEGAGPNGNSARAPSYRVADTEHLLDEVLPELFGERWQMAAEIMKTIPGFDDWGGATSEQIAVCTTIPVVLVDEMLGVLEAEGLILAAENPDPSLAVIGAYGRRYRVREKGRQLHWVLRVVFGARMNPPQLVRSLVAGLELALGNPLEGWVGSSMLQLLLGINSNAKYRPRLRRMRRALQHLCEAGVIERQTLPGRPAALASEYRLGLAWVTVPEPAADADPDHITR